MEPKRCRSGTAPAATAAPRDDASPALTPERPDVIWCSRIAIAARAVASSYVSPKPVAWLRHSRSACDVPSPGRDVGGHGAQRADAGGQPVDRARAAGQPQVLAGQRDPLDRRRRSARPGPGPPCMAHEIRWSSDIAADGTSGSPSGGGWTSGSSMDPQGRLSAGRRPHPSNEGPTWH